VVTQPQATPVSELEVTEARTGRPYWLYVPSNYSDQRSWPLVITLHGGQGWDSAHAQVREWKALAEDRGLIVAAPELKSTQGLMAMVGSPSSKDLAADDQAIVNVLEEVSLRYKVDGQNVLLTGYAAGGYALYYTGLRHPELFSMLIARDASFRPDLLDGLELDDQARTLPIMIFWGKDNSAGAQKQSWQAYRCLRERQFYQTRNKEVEGGSLRRPDLVYQFWAECRQRARTKS
jgi:poly(3-hydroxybutyrate) depolymerase